MCSCASIASLDSDTFVVSFCELCDPLTCVDHAGSRAVAAVGVKCRGVLRF
jgi:hypothetical protein